MTVARHRSGVLIWTGAVTVTVGFVVMLAWHLRGESLIRLMSSLPAMRYNTAVAFFCVGLSLIALARGWRRTGVALAAVAALIGLASLIQYVAGVDLGIDQLLVRDFLAKPDESPGRMALATALCFLLIGLSIIATFNEPAHVTAGTLLAVLVGAQALAVLLFFILGIDATHRPQLYTGMAVHTATLFALVGAAIIVARPVSGVRGESQWMTLAPGLGIFVMALMLWYGLRAQETLALQRLVDTHVFSMREEVEKEITERSLVISRMASRWNVEGGTPRARWEVDAAECIRDWDGLVRIDWIDAANIVRWVVPSKDAAGVAGMSLEGEPWLDATRERALREGRAQVSPTFPLPDGDFGFYLFMPVSVGGKPDGFLRDTLHARELLQPLLMHQLSLGYAVEVNDGNHVIFSSGRTGDSGGIFGEQAVGIEGVRWTLRLYATPALASASRTALPAATLGGGMLLALLLSFAIKQMFDARAQRTLIAANESRLRQSEEKYRGMLESLEYGVFVAQDYRFVFVNAALPAMLGYRREEFVDLTFSEVIAAEALPTFMERYVQRISPGPEPVRRYELQLRKKNSDERLWVELNAQRTVFAGRPAVLGIFNDISERKQQEAALQAAEQRFRLMVECVKDYVIYILDAEGRVATWNVGAERIKGYPTDEILGQPFSTFFTQEDIVAGKPQLALERARETGRFDEEGWRRRKDGTRFWASAVLTALHDHENRLIGFAEITRDLTERRFHEKKLMEALNKLEATRQSLEERVAERTTELASARDRIGRFARDLDANIEAERRRLAREVHDQLGQVFTGLNMSLRASAAQLPRRFVADTSALLEHGLGVARKIAGELRPPLLDDLGLASALQHLAESSVAAHDIEVKVEVNDDQRLNRDQANQLFRIAQEALTNILRHAGARHVRIDGAVDENTYRVLIENDGRRFDPERVRPGAQGITSMRERAGLIGGTFEIMSGEGGGTLIAVRFPLDRSQRKDV